MEGEVPVKAPLFFMSWKNLRMGVYTMRGGLAVVDASPPHIQSLCPVTYCVCRRRLYLVPTLRRPLPTRQTG